MPAARAVTVIPPTINLHTHAPAVAAQKRRAAGYARVSTDSDEQFTSYEAQINYYTRYIKSNQEWEFVSVYTDEGISGTNTKHRVGFNQMIADALSGKIDLIVTKSVSRFARNTVDSLTTIRKLKEHGVEVYFEKENIWTFDSKGELLITIMSSLAQEESRSLSENITWGQRKRFSDGKVSLPYKQFLGYRKGPDGFPEIVEDEAKIVRRIYALFMEGKTSYAIAKALTADGIPTPSGKKKWGASVVQIRLISSVKSGRSTRAKCSSIGSSRATSPSSSPMSSMWCRPSSLGAKVWASTTAAAGCSPPAWSAVTAVAATAPRSGTPTASTAAWFGSAMGSSATRRNAALRICWRRTSRPVSWQRSINCWRARMLCWRIAASCRTTSPTAPPLTRNWTGCSRKSRW